MKTMFAVAWLLAAGCSSKAAPPVAPLDVEPAAAPAQDATATPAATPAAAPAAVTPEEPAASTQASDPLESAAILARKPATQRAMVKHILLGWTEAHAEDPRGIKRTRAQLEVLVKATVAKLAKGADIGLLMSQLSEDAGSAKSGEGYEVTPDAKLVPPFKALSLRLQPEEVGVVRTKFGIHIIQRME